MDDRYRGLYKKMWETKCSRFNAHKRSELTESRASSAVIIMTFTVLAVSAFKAGAFFTVLTDKAQRAGDVSLVLCSAALLILELYIKGRQNAEVAQKFHKSGLEISRIYDLFTFEINKQSPDDTRIESLIGEYHSAIGHTDNNHLYIDLQQVRCEHPNDYGIGIIKWPFYAAYINLKRFMYAGGLYVVLSYATAISAASAIYYYGFK